MNQVGEVTAIVEDHVEGLAIREEDGLLDAPHIFLVSLSLPGIDWHTTGGHGSCCVVLQGKSKV